MKTMKKVLVNTCCILGILSFGLLAGCADIINDPSSVSPDISAGVGRAVVSIGPRLNGARTFMPTEQTGYYAGLSYAYVFTATGRNPVSGSITDEPEGVELVAGTWDLTVTGRDDEDKGVLQGTVTGIVITARETTDVSVALAAFTGSEADEGTLSYSVTLPANIIKGTLTVYNWDGETVRETVDLLTTAGLQTDDGTLPAGYYRIALDLYTGTGVFHRTDIAHIYPGLTTDAVWTIGDGDFIDATVDDAQTDFTDVLTAISALSSGDNKVYLLSDAGETMPATSVFNSNGPVTVTVDGGGRTVSLNSSGGSLITVENDVTLVLRNITLMGRGTGFNNTAPLVAVRSGGTLELETGARITANRNYSSSSSVYGGGVYVYDNGTFTMNGGEITDNTASSTSSYSNSYSYGGGVYVNGNGTFTMNGGEITGNTAIRSSTSFSDSYGGGVYVNGNGTFTINGGKITDNTVSSTSSNSYSNSYSYGGGVYVNDNGTFTMNSGEISNNRVSASSYYSYSYGGGVYVRSGGTFTMSGGEITNNTDSAINSSGGGVYIYGSNTTFTMSGGKISGNTASSTNASASSPSSNGGGVYVGSGGTFAMSNGEISGNTSSSSSSSAYGGGVYVNGSNTTFAMSGGKISGNRVDTTAYSTYPYGGGVCVDSGSAFTMSGGEITDNTISSNASAYGGGVYVNNDSTFTMSGGARVNANNTVCLFYSYGVVSSVTIGGDFTGSDGPVAKIDLSGIASNWSGKAALKPAEGYSGDFSDIKSRFILGNFGSTPITGYVIDDDGTLQESSAGITDVSYDNVSGGAWTELSDGRRQSPAIVDDGITKSRVSFTATQANASIRIKLEVSSEYNNDYNNGDFAFISTLDNDSATYDSGYYNYSKIAGTNSVTVTIPVPTAGEHFVEVGYQKDNLISAGDDCAWYRVILE